MAKSYSSSAILKHWKAGTECACPVVFETCPIDTCQNKLSADRYHVTVSRAQVYSSSRSRVFMKLTADQVFVFRLD